ncbi:MAG: DUF402 domain-containing protein [Actinomycetota bacterium]
MRFAAGQIVTYRELWGDAVMTAIPMRVLVDGDSLSVLHLAAGTDFRAARAPDGGPVRDLGDWVSVEATWTGGSLVRLLPAGEWYCLDVEFDGDHRFAGYYVNFQTPMVRTELGFDTVDLVLDLVVAPDGTARTKDADDLARAVADGHIDEQMAERVRHEEDRLRAAFEIGEVPLDAERWRDARDRSSLEAQVGASWGAGRTGRA